MLVCNKSYLSSLPNSFYMLGTFLSIFVGYLSDTYGRKRCCVYLSATLSLTLVLVEIVQFKYFQFGWLVRYGIFSAAQLVTGSMLNSLYSVSYVLLIELTTKNYHTLVTNASLYMFVVGEFTVAILAYFARDWQVLMSINAVYSLVCTVLIAFFFTESPRYLIEKEKYEEASKVFEKIAKFNGKPFESVIRRRIMFSKYDEDEEKIIINKDDSLEKFIDHGKKKTPASGISHNHTGQQKAFHYVFHSKSRVIKFVSIIYIWFAINLIYFGVGLGKFGELRQFEIFHT